jgi:hypothetical protein
MKNVKIEPVKDSELDAVAGGERAGGVGGVKGVSNIELDAVVGGERAGGVGGVKG